VQAHGSESYFVLGEGLLGESLRGRTPTLPSAAGLLLFAFEGKKSLLAPLG
jgi:hypothetical protein